MVLFTGVQLYSMWELIALYEDVYVKSEICAGFITLNIKVKNCFKAVKQCHNVTGKKTKKAALNLYFQFIVKIFNDCPSLSLKPSRVAILLID